MDFSWKLLFEGRKKKNTKKTACSFVQGNCKCIPFKNSSIKKILCNSISQCLEEIEFRKMISEIDRVLDKPGICFLGDISYETCSSFSNNKEKDNNLNYIGLRSVLKKIKFIVFLKSKAWKAYRWIKKRIVDYKRGFEIQRMKLNKYDPDIILNWIKEVNIELKCQILEKGNYTFYSNRYDILIKK